ERAPCSVPTRPVWAMPRSTAMPNDSSSRATISAVRRSSKAVSGWAWISCRQAAISAWKSAMRLITGMVLASHDMAPAQPGDVAVAVAELLEDRRGVLAGIGAGGLEPARRAAQAHRLADQFDAAERGMLDRLRDPEMLDLRVGEHLVDRIDRAG